MCGSYCLSGFPFFSPTCGQLLSIRCHLHSFTSIHLSCKICVRPLNLCPNPRLRGSTNRSHMLLIRHGSDAPCHLNHVWATAEDVPHIPPLLHIFTARVMVSTLPLRSVMPDCRHSHICFLEQRRGSLQRAPSGVWGMCAHI